MAPRPHSHDQVGPERVRREGAEARGCVMEQNRAERQAKRARHDADDPTERVGSGFGARERLQSRVCFARHPMALHSAMIGGVQVSGFRYVVFGAKRELVSTHRTKKAALRALAEDARPDAGRRSVRCRSVPVARRRVGAARAGSGRGTRKPCGHASGLSVSSAGTKDCGYQRTLQVQGHNRRSRRDWNAFPRCREGTSRTTNSVATA